MNTKRNTAERCLSLYVKKTETCWIWTGIKNNKGYAKVTCGGKTLQGHRFIYEALKGKIEDGLVIDHLCRNSACVNPEHLEPVTQQENTLRGNGPASINAKKIECDSGHMLSGANLYITPGGRRQCRACRRKAARKCYWGKIANLAII